MDLDLRSPFRWAVLYRAFATGALFFGLLLVIVGVFAGFGSAAISLVTDPLNPGPAIEQANPLITLAVAVVGFVVWQVGKTYALFATLPQAAGRSATEQFNSAKLRSEVLEGLDERLAEMQTDIEETRRNVQELKRTDHAQQFDERDHLEPSDDRPRSNSSVDDDRPRSNGAGDDTRESSVQQESAASGTDTSRVGSRSDSSERSASRSGPDDEGDDPLA